MRAGRTSASTRTSIASPTGLAGSEPPRPMKQSRRSTGPPTSGGGRTSIYIWLPGVRTCADRYTRVARRVRSAISARGSELRGLQRRQSIFRLGPAAPDPVRNRNRQSVASRYGQGERQHERAEERQSDFPVRHPESEIHADDADRQRDAIGHNPYPPHVAVVT